MTAIFSVFCCPTLPTLPFYARKPSPSKNMPTDLSLADSQMSFDSGQKPAGSEWLQTCIQGDKMLLGTSQPEGDSTNGAWYKTVFGGQHTFPSYSTMAPLEHDDITTPASEVKPAVRLNTLERVIRVGNPRKKVTERTARKGYECSACVNSKIDCKIRLKDPLADCLGCEGDPKRKCNRRLVLEGIYKTRAKANKCRWVRKKRDKERGRKSETENSQQAPPPRREDTLPS
jgi:hypothetical protein